MNWHRFSLGPVVLLALFASIFPSKGFASKPGPGKATRPASARDMDVYLPRLRGELSGDLGARLTLQTAARQRAQGIMTPLGQMIYVATILGHCIWVGEPLAGGQGYRFAVLTSNYLWWIIVTPDGHQTEQHTAVHLPAH